MKRPTCALVRVPAICVALFAAALAAQEIGSPPGGRENIYVPAEPLQRSAPPYPLHALSQGREGWATVSFIISEEGDVIEPMIEDSSSSDFDEPTLRAVRKWRYKPATLGGKPVEQSMVQTTIRYYLSDAKGARRQFIGKYRAIYKLITAKNFTEAGPLIQALGEGELNFYEDAWFWWLKYVYLDATGKAEPQALEEALRKALGSSESEDDAYLQPDAFVAASRRRSASTCCGRATTTSAVRLPYSSASKLRKQRNARSPIKTQSSFSSRAMTKSCSSSTSPSSFGKRLGSTSTITGSTACCVARSHSATSKTESSSSSMCAALARTGGSFRFQKTKS